MAILELFAAGESTQVSEITYVLSERVGVGGDRVCWRHPANRSLCVKVSKPEPERLQNEIDFHYARYLARRNIVGPHVPRVHGWIETNRGQGLVMDLVQQPDGTPCIPLPEALRTGMITQAEAETLVREAFGWLMQRKVILADCGGSNFLIRQSQDGSRHLVFVDGLGARHFGLKYYLRRTFGFMARRKGREFQAKILGLLADKSSKLWVAKKPSHLEE